MEGMFKVIVDGNDVTDRWNPRLETVSVTRSARESSDTCDLQLADPDGLTRMPTTGGELIVHLGRVNEGLGRVFEGFVDSVRTSGGKKKGRKIAITGTSVDNKSKVKAGALRSASDMTFKEVAAMWGAKHDLTSITVAGSIADEFRPYWLMQHESFMGWGQRMARELGGSFKVIGKRGFFAPLNEGISATGKQLTTIYGTWGSNLIDWDITPIIGRPQFGRVVSRHYDINAAKWKEVEAAIENAGIDVDFRALLGSANEANAAQSGKSSAKESEREKGDGTVTILGDYAAEPEAAFILSGAKDGADGTYVIDSLNHNLTKSDGFTTSLTLKRPSGGAGVAGGTTGTAGSAGTDGGYNGRPGVVPGSGFGGPAI